MTNASAKIIVAIIVVIALVLVGGKVLFNGSVCPITDAAFAAKLAQVDDDSHDSAERVMVAAVGSAAYMVACKAIVNRNSVNSNSNHASQAHFYTVR